MNGSLGTAAALGAVTGLRSTVPAACVARELADRRGGWRFGRRTNGPASWLASDGVALLLTVAAAGELLIDKMPGIPDRVAPAPLLGRALIGGFVGAAAVDPDQRAAGAAVGAIGAVAGAFAGWFLRGEVARVTMMPDTAIAIAEDAVAITAARELATRI